MTISLDIKILYFDLFSVELIAKGIFQNVDCQGLLSARSVSLAWQEAVDNARVWKIVLDKDVKYLQQLLFSFYYSNSFPVGQLEENV